MKRSDIDAGLRGMRWGAETAGDQTKVEAVEKARALLPDSEPPPEWAAFISALLNAGFDAGWKGVNLTHFRFAFELATMCRDAVNDNMTMPADVATAYAEYDRKPHSGKLGNRPYVAGAFALARGYYTGSGGLDGARAWVIREGVLELGERAGLTFPGIPKSEKRRRTIRA